MANYIPQHFEPRAKAVNVKGVANRAVATVLTAGLIAQPLMSPLAIRRRVNGTPCAAIRLARRPASRRM